MDRHLDSCVLRHAAVAVMGVLVVNASYAIGIPGSGAFLLVAGAAGLGTAILAPGWIGYAILLGSIAVVSLMSVVLGAYGPLISLVIGALWVPATVGWLLGYVARRVRIDGLGASIRNVRVMLAALGIPLLTGLIALVAVSGPP